MKKEQFFTTKRELAVQRLTDAILVGRYQPGQSLRQNQLMEELQLGATPVREAVLELVARGLLTHESHHGMRVANLNAERVANTYAVRALLESEAARLSTLAADDDAVAEVGKHLLAMESALARDDMAALGEADGNFHRTLYEGAGNPVLAGLIDTMWQQFPRYMLLRDRERVQQSIAEHGEILRHFSARDAAKTAQAVKDHIMGGYAAFERFLQSANANSN
jgi:DNA-binding GntR family transcriptional regulator